MDKATEHKIKKAVLGASIVSSKSVFVHLFVEVIPKSCVVLLSDNLGGLFPALVLHISQ